MKASSVFLALLSTTLLTIPATAQDETKAGSPPADRSNQMAKRREEMIKRFDKNGDGKLDEEEKAAAKEGMKKEGGGPGGPGGPGGGRMREEMMKRFDKNGDGKLDDAERAEMGKAREKFQQNGGMDRVRGQMLKQFDKDGDGRLNEAERAEAEAFRADQVKRFDRDGDGRLNEQERTEAMKAFQADHPDFVPPGK